MRMGRRAHYPRIRGGRVNEEEVQIQKGGTALATLEAEILQVM